MKDSTRARSIMSSLVCALAALILVTESAYTPQVASAGGAQQVTVTVTSTSGIVVIAIPGFPAESILLGLALGFAMLLVIRRRRQACPFVDGLKDGVPCGGELA